MNLLKTFVAASALTIASFGTFAGTVTSGGITWNPDYVSLDDDTDFFAIGDYHKSSDNGVESGYGSISKINDNADYCAGGFGTCQLSFSYSNFIQDVNNPGEFISGTLNFYVNDFAVINSVNDTEEGDLWLSLNLVDGNYTELALPNGSAVGTNAHFDVIEEAGTVWSNFDTNTLADGADVVFHGLLLVASDGSKLLQSSSFGGNSIPEPTTLAIFGLGLLGLARMRKAK